MSAQDIKDFFTKIYLLWSFSVSAWGEWTSEVWQRDLDQPYCCSGDPMECGCQGMTVRELYSPKSRKPAGGCE